MRLDVAALTWAMGLLWGAVMAWAAFGDLIFPGYAGAFLEWAASFYPGYHGPAGLGSAVVVTLYGVVDGAVGGFLLAWLYNRFADGAAGRGA